MGISKPGSKGGIGSIVNRRLIFRGFGVFVFMVLVFLVVLGGFWLIRGGVGLHSAVALGKIAPEIMLPNLQGKVEKLSDYRGKAVLINFWASWCLPCREEMPDLEGVYQEFKEEGLVVLGVNLQEDRRTVGEFVSRFGLSFSFLVDTSGEVAEKYNVLSLPTSYFIDREGIVRDLNVGALRRETLVRKLRRIL